MLLGMLSRLAHKLFSHLAVPPIRDGSSSTSTRLLMTFHQAQSKQGKNQSSLCNMSAWICWDQNRAEGWQELMETNPSSPLNKRINEPINNGIPASLAVIMLLLACLCAAEPQPQAKQHNRCTRHNWLRCPAESGRNRMECGSERKNGRVTV